MTFRKKFYQLPDAIRVAFIAKLLARESYRDISQWLSQQHGITVSAMTIQRISKHLLALYLPMTPLIELGMPIKEIVKNRIRIEVIGIGQVKQVLIDKLTEKDGELFAYLDKPEGEQ